MDRGIAAGALSLAVVLTSGWVCMALSRPQMRPVAYASVSAAVTAPLQELHAIIPHDDTNVMALPEDTVSASSSAPAASLHQDTAGTTYTAQRIQNAYLIPQLFPASVNALSRNAVVNIMCMPSGGSLDPISGTGVIIDPRGVILTNAHVAQYVLLSEDASVNLYCTIRTGSPARDRWIAEVIYLPPVWAEQHAIELNTSRPMGTGEHDYALLRIVASANQLPLPSVFSYVSPDTRAGIGFLNDTVLAASYPAEFIGGIGMQDNLYGVSSFSTIKQLITFSTSSIDSLSLGGVIEAQSGSSGGAVVNMWGRLIGLLSTMTDGSTTANRDLRAITLNYIDRDIQVQTGMNLSTFLAGDLSSREDDFNTRYAEDMFNLYAPRLSRAQ